ncbi:glucose-6-phosphate dehydrogenase [Enemella sp. A6]|uniref:glucose-6-phosphate dehydrogenase n=1 Tax=Enemella sp. A6 TaxID=3440152 RepID=UPI003EBEFB78
MSTRNVADRTTLILLGAGGDLTERLLLPGLGQALTRQPDMNLRLIGAARSDHEDWRDHVRGALESAGIDLEVPSVQRLVNDTVYIPTDATDPQELDELLEGRTTDRTIIYCALSPRVTEDFLDALLEVELPQRLELALEKPIGIDQAAARRVNLKAEQLVGAGSVFRVDHFLGMAAARDLLGLRLTNRVLEPVLNCEHVAGIEIVFNESIGLEGRAEFYEQTGAIVDMLQSHLLQVMALLLVPPPNSLLSDELPTQIGYLLEQTELAGAPSEAVVAGRYTAGEVDGRQLPGYLEEAGTDPDGKVETYARLALRVNNWCWSDIPITIESGKAIGSSRKEVLVRFKPALHEYPNFGAVPVNTLRLSFEDSAMALRLNTASPDGEVNTLELACQGVGPECSAYGWVMTWLLENNRSFSVAARAAEQGWRIIQPALDAIASGEVPIQDYPAGTVDPLR